MRPVAKAQIYSVNENLPVDQVARMWGVFNQLERTREEKENDEVADKKVNCERIVKLCLLDVYNILQWTRVHIYSLDNLAGYGTPNLLEKKYLNKLILRYIYSSFPSVESLLLKLLWSGGGKIGLHA